MNFSKALHSLFFLLVLSAFLVQGNLLSDELLPSWNSGKNKEAILRFITEAVDQSSTGYIEPSDRIAVFDNDGTLQVEKPYAFVDMFALYRIRDLAVSAPSRLSEKYPDWKENETILKLKNSSLEELPQILKDMKYDDLLMLFNLANTSDSQQNIETALKYYVYNYKHVRFNKTPAELLYKPMIELIELLNSKGFKVYFVSGSTADYLREFSENIGISKENVIGWEFNAELRSDSDGKYYLYKTGPTVEPISNKDGKVVNIQRYIGKTPVAAVGNSSGDMAMLTYVRQGNSKNLCLILNHNDEEREYSYDFGEKVWSAAKEQDWHVIDMKTDFKVIF